MNTNKRKLLTGPYLVWAVGFIILPLLMIIYYGFTSGDGQFTLDNFLAIADPIHAKALWESILIAFGSTLISLVLAYPLAYILSNSARGKSGTIIMLFMLPMWINFLLRTYAWMTLLENTGIINRLLGIFGIGPLAMINTQGAVVLGMVYNYLPFMILPLYSVMTKIENGLIEAAQDLGAPRSTVFSSVVLPLSMPGVMTGITMVFVPAVSTFIISRMLGGGSNMMIGDLIELQFLGNAYNPNLGAAISLGLMILILFCMSMLNQLNEEDKEGMII